MWLNIVWPLDKSFGMYEPISCFLQWQNWKCGQRIVEDCYSNLSAFCCNSLTCFHQNICKVPWFTNFFVLLQQKLHETSTILELRIWGNLQQCLGSTVTCTCLHDKECIIPFEVRADSPIDRRYQVLYQVPGWVFRCRADYYLRMYWEPTV